MKKTIGIIICVVIIFLAWKFLIPLQKSIQQTENNSYPEGNPSAAETSVTILPAPAFPVHELIHVNSSQVTSPLPNPLVLTGEAKGNWYFEASFPVELKNNANVVIGTGVAQAQSDWMTTNFVPFTVSITFPAQPAGSTGTLILKKDNPSGEPANDDQYVVPVTF